MRNRRDGLLAFSDIVVGVIYGTDDGLSDKYDILRGVNRGAFHAVANLTEHVHVHAGRNFWTWLNYGETRTQDWMMNAMLEAVTAFRQQNPEIAQIVVNFREAFVERFSYHVDVNGAIDWMAILTEING